MRLRVRLLIPSMGGSLLAGSFATFDRPSFFLSPFVVWPFLVCFAVVGIDGTVFGPFFSASFFFFFLVAGSVASSAPVLAASTVVGITSCSRFSPTFDSVTDSLGAVSADVGTCEWGFVSSVDFTSLKVLMSEVGLLSSAGSVALDGCAGRLAPFVGSCSSKLSVYQSEVYNKAWQGATTGREV